jgi:hypothetical protein
MRNKKTSLTYLQQEAVTQQKWNTYVSWFLYTLATTVAISLALSVFSTLTTPLWLIILGTATITFFLAQPENAKWIIYPSLLVIFVSLIVKYGQ